LTSLSQKLAILGPPRLVAEVPAEREAARAIFSACGYRLEGRLIDWHRKAMPANDAAGQDEVREALAPVGLEDLAAASLLDTGRRSWQRDLPVLAKLGERLAGLGFHSPERLEAWVLWDEGVPGEAWPLLAVGAMPGAFGRLGLQVVLDEIGRRAGGAPLLLARAAPGEVDADRLAELGFERGQEHLLFTGRAQAA
jgi:hypothetical protein